MWRSAWRGWSWHSLPPCSHGSSCLFNHRTALLQTTDSDVAKVFGEDAGIAYGFGSVFDEVRQGVPVLSALFGVTGRERAAALDSLVYCQAWPTVAGGCMPSHLPPPFCPAYLHNHLLPHTLPPGRSGLPLRPPWTSWWMPSPERCLRSGSLAIGEGKPRCWHCCACVPSRRLLPLQSSLTQRCISAAAVPAVNCKLHPATPEQFSVSDGHSTEVSHCTRCAAWARLLATWWPTPRSST